MTPVNRIPRGAARARQAGVSLIELMIALVLGLLVVGAAIGVFISNKATYRSTQNLARIQESAQVAFELLSRDIREAGANPCDATLAPANITTAAATATPDGADWYLAVDYPLYGFEDGGPTHVSGTDVIQILRPGDDLRGLTADLASGATSVTVAPATPLFKSGDPVMICDMRVLAVARANGDSTAGGSLSFASGAGTNSCDYFPMPNTGTCAGAATAYAFPKFSSVISLQGVRWFLRDPDGNPDNGYSLYRQVNGAAAEEVVQGVANLQFHYLTDAGYVSASVLTTAADWRNVRAVRMTLVLRETERTGTGGQHLTRVVENVVALRNRVL
ncbi:hypothetical protein EIM48_00905 [Pseudoxanthomonas sp. SGNA-20]|uniref:PilW family protein n=1 Tax=Pseudoxanthomonas sp. SGNA-20 TaxID=2493088 RepID=UPI000F640A2E|nr:PilW family protein [Pseudoxanthomonas sp. SGNA-20]RRN58630.1 hypothetical protein EIM48_00905 [Pseudoxanthomonas sp. SGNA-20]